ncbi:unnamed protein product, partial [Callosobruchus maculatus]
FPASYALAVREFASADRGDICAIRLPHSESRCKQESYSTSMGNFCKASVNTYNLLIPSNKATHTHENQNSLFFVTIRVLNLTYPNIIFDDIHTFMLVGNFALKHAWIVILDRKSDILKKTAT